jgi:hypothetical protein
MRRAALWSLLLAVAVPVAATGAPVVAAGTSVDGRVLASPLSVSLALSVVQAEQGQTFSATARVSNAATYAVADVRLTLRTSDGLSALDGAERVITSLAAGAAAARSFSLCASAPGSYVLVASAAAETAAATPVSADSSAVGFNALPADRTCGGYAFRGFLSPVDNPPVVNLVKAGRAVPIKFSLGGGQGLAVLAAGYPTSVRIDCSSNLPVDAIEETTTAGASTLTYDKATDTYTYVWSTDRTWAGQCRQFILLLADGSIHRALFEFKR